MVGLLVKKNSKNNAKFRIPHVKVRVIRELPVLTQIAGGNNCKTVIPENKNLWTDKQPKLHGKYNKHYQHLSCLNVTNSARKEINLG